MSGCSPERPVDTTPSALEKIAALPGVEAAAKAGLRQQEALADGEIANSLELLDLPETADYTRRWHRHRRDRFRLPSQP